MSSLQVPTAVSVIPENAATSVEDWLTATDPGVKSANPAISTDPHDAENTVNAETMTKTAKKGEKGKRAEEETGDGKGKETAKPKRRPGNKGNFEGKELEFLELWFTKYVGVEGKKGKFWKDFFKAWWTSFPCISTTTETKTSAMGRESEASQGDGTSAGPQQGYSLRNGVTPPTVMSAEDAKAKTAFIEVYMKMEAYSEKVAAAYKIQYGASLEEGDKTEEEGDDDDDDDDELQVRMEKKPLTPKQLWMRLALSRRVAIAAQLLKAETNEVQKDVARERDDQFATLQKKHKLFLKAAGDDELDDTLVSEQVQDDCQKNITSVTQPLLNGLNRFMGMHFTLVGGTPPRDRDDIDAEWTIVSLHAGKTKGPALKTFSEWLPGKFHNEWMAFYVKYLWEAFALGEDPPKATTVPVLRRKKKKAGKGHTAVVVGASPNASDSSSEEEEQGLVSFDAARDDDDDDMLDWDAEGDAPNVPMKKYPSLPEGMVIGEALATEIAMLEEPAKRKRMAELCRAAQTSSYQWEQENKIAENRALLNAIGPLPTFPSKEVTHRKKRKSPAISSSTGEQPRRSTRGLTQQSSKGTDSSPAPS
ncbi:hypothetical protein C8J56DRAFT_881999 [Mycena floridula]|nr:hypothetical protein C8J56DRAFT_881999 [Mycena floridula]